MPVQRRQVQCSLKAGFSVGALLTFWTGQFLVVGGTALLELPYQLGELEQQKRTPSEFFRSEFQGQGVSTLVPPKSCKGEPGPWPSPSFWCQLALVGIPWLADA